MDLRPGLASSRHAAGSGGSVRGRLRVAGVCCRRLTGQSRSRASGQRERVLALGLAARAIGEFRHVGFFKRVRGTRFARLDTIFCSPLCLALAVGVALVAWLRGREVLGATADRGRAGDGEGVHAWRAMACSRMLRLRTGAGR